MTQRNNIMLYYFVKVYILKSRKYFIEVFWRLSRSLLSNEIMHYTSISMLLGTPYSLDLFQFFPHVFIIHWEEHYASSSKSFNINLIYDKKMKNKHYLMCLTSSFWQKCI
jgi:hypothetical protein